MYGEYLNESASTFGYGTWVNVLSYILLHVCSVYFVTLLTGTECVLVDKEPQTQLSSSSSSLPVERRQKKKKKKQIIALLFCQKAFAAVWHWISGKTQPRTWWSSPSSSGWSCVLVGGGGWPSVLDWLLRCFQSARRRVIYWGAWRPHLTLQVAAQWAY